MGGRARGSSFRFLCRRNRRRDGGSRWPPGTPDCSPCTCERRTRPWKSRDRGAKRRRLPRTSTRLSTASTTQLVSRRTTPASPTISRPFARRSTIAQFAEACPVAPIEGPAAPISSPATARCLPRRPRVFTTAPTLVSRSQLAGRPFRRRAPTANRRPCDRIATLYRTPHRKSVAL